MNKSNRDKWAVRWGLAVLAALGGLFVFDTFIRTYRPSSGGADRVAWVDESGAAGLARDSGKPMLLNFTASWCPPCRVMESRVYADEAVAKRMEEMTVPVKMDLSDRVNITPAHKRASRYGVSAIPTRIVVDARGKEIGRQVGYASAEELVGWLEGAVEGI